MVADNLDTQAFASSTAHEDGIEFAALYTLQHSLTSHTKQASCDLHRNVSVWAILDKAVAQRIGDSNAPWRARRRLLAGDETVIDPAMQRR